MNPENFLTLFWQAGLTQAEGGLKRGVKISSQPLPTEQSDFLRGLTKNIIEPGAQSWQTPGFIRKQGSQVLIYVSDSRNRRFRRLAYVGYVNLNAFRPALEFRSSLPYHLLLFISLLFVFPLAIAGFLINFSAEKQAIEAFLREKMTSHSPIP